MSKSDNQFSPVFLIYGCLAEGAAHGYEIHQRISTDLGFVWSIRQSQLYSLLKRLENQKLIIGELQPQEGRPDRKKFYLSEKAKITYQKWVNSPVWVSMRALRMELLAKIYFLSYQDPDKIEELIVQQIEKIESSLKSIAAETEKIPQEQSINKISMQIKYSQIEMMFDYLKQFNIDQIRS